MMPGRHYDVDGERYPSVTTVLQILDKPHLAQWRGRLGNREADRVGRESRELGSAVHRACEIVNLGAANVDGNAWAGMLAAHPPEVAPFVTAYLRWFRAHVDRVLAAEALVISRAHRYAGTADLVAVLRGDTQPTVVDIKTSNSVGGEWPLQLAAYRLALAEEGIACTRRMIVRLPSRTPGTLETHEFDEHERDERGFLNCLHLWRWRMGPRAEQPSAMRIQFTRRRS